MPGSPGNYLRRIRERLGLSVRDVQEASAFISGEEKNEDFYLSAARLSQIENQDSVPSIAKIFSLSVIYGIDLLEIIGHYGVNPDRVHHYRSLLKLQATHPVSTDTRAWCGLNLFAIQFEPSAYSGKRRSSTS